MEVRGTVAITAAAVSLRVATISLVATVIRKNAELKYIILSSPIEFGDAGL